MKKRIALLLAMLMLALALSAAALGEDAEAATARRDIPLDSEEFETLQHEVFQANSLDALLKKHESVTFDLTDVPENDYDWRDYFYITREGCYTESQTSSCYESDRVIYLLLDDGSSVPMMQYGLDMRSDYDLYQNAGYQLVPYDEASWFDSSTEAHFACYIENGRLYSVDRFTAEGTKDWFAQEAPNWTYNGETIYTEVIADAGTLEILEFNEYLEDGDGEWRRVCHLTAAYDEPQPRRARNLIAAFERWCENTIEATLVVDPGTEREFSKSLTLPVGSSIIIRSDNQGHVALADDPDVTSVTHWDGMTSRTMYVITQPTDEQWQRYTDFVAAIKAAEN